MLKHTPADHSDHEPLKLAIAELTTLVGKIDRAEREAAEAEKLKELEALFDRNVEV